MIEKLEAQLEGQMGGIIGDLDNLLNNMTSATKGQAALEKGLPAYTKKVDEQSKLDKACEREKDNIKKEIKNRVKEQLKELIEDKVDEFRGDLLDAESCEALFDGLGIKDTYTSIMDAANKAAEDA